MVTQKDLVLAVDDKETNLVLLVGMLESEGYQVITATDGMQAWDILETNAQDFQAVLLDRVMPNMDGLAVLKKMKEDPRFKFIPVIMQTVANAANEVLEGIEAGAYYYLTKPYQKKILVGIVQAAIRRVGKMPFADDSMGVGDRSLAVEQQLDRNLVRPNAA